MYWPACGFRPDAMCIISIGAVPERSMPQKIVDRLPWWLDRVLQGYMTVHEVDRAYGHGSTTKPRKHATFADYIRDRLRYAEDAAVESELRALLIRTHGRTVTAQAKSAASVRINRLLAETGNERAGRLRELIAELDAPIHTIS
jgi:hypothetical protein